MPAPGKPGRREPAAIRARRFGDWLAHEMKQRALSNGDVVALLNHPSYDSSAVSTWTTTTGQRAAPSELAAWLVADALRLPAPEVLRIAGFHEIADRVEHIAAHGVQPPPQDPVLAELEKVGLPELTAPLAREYERDLFGARRRVELELAELRRRLDRGDGQDAAEPR